MRRFLVLSILLVGVVAIAAPAGAVSEQFYEVPFAYTGLFPNPCTGEDVEHTAVGTIYVHEVIKGDRVHVNEQWRIEASSAEGFYASLNGTDTYNYDDDRFVASIKGTYVFRNDAGEKYRWRNVAHVTAHGGEVIVEFNNFDFSCLGN